MFTLKHRSILTYALRYNEDKSRLKLNIAADVNGHNNLAYTVHKMRKAVRGLSFRKYVTAGTGVEGRTSG